MINIHTPERLLCWATLLLSTFVYTSCDSESSSSMTDHPLTDMGVEDMSSSTRDMTVDMNVSERSPQEVILSLGRIEGTVEESALGPVISFKGIPYAKPPIGELRLRPPQAVQPWETLFRADSFGPTCPQDGALTNRDAPQSEDCLTLNIWTPTDESGQGIAREANKPVMVWIHGGGFVQGSGSFEVYNGARLSKRGAVVVVTLNYRLGLMGFLNTRRLADDSYIGSEGESAELNHARQVGNFGIQDQVLALKWIKEHIAHFGGDPENITIFGESAGGFSICSLLSSPLSEGLISRAIIQSGGGCNGFTPLGDQGEVLAETTAEQSSTRILSELGCSDLRGGALHDCLEALSTEDLLNGANAASVSVLGLPELGPVTDGHIIPNRLDHLIRDGVVSPIPTLIGSNEDEMTLFTFNSPITLELYSMTRAFFGPLADMILELYPATNDQEARVSYNQLFSDLIFVCPTLLFASTMVQQSEDIWVYHFTHRLSNGPLVLLGSTHALEIPFVFNNTHIELYGSSANEIDKRLSDQMSEAWLSFAHTGSPSTDELNWPRYAPPDPSSRIDDGKLMLWGDPPMLNSEEIRAGRCQKLKDLGLLRGL